jgi:hypothetical protein
MHRSNGLSGTSGNNGLGILRQPSCYNLDLTPDKRIPPNKSERRVQRMRLEARNVLSRADFPALGTGLQLPGGDNATTLYGQYTAALPSRVLSDTLRVEF